MCNRRLIIGDKIFCQPKEAPIDLPLIEKIKHPEYYRKKQVSSDICLACPACEKGFKPEVGMQDRPREMNDGSLVYPKRGWEPPPVPDGYRRKSENLQSSDAWTMLPVLSECRYRRKESSVGKCGATHYWYHCNYFDVKIMAKRCVQCEVADGML